MLHDPRPIRHRCTGYPLSHVANRHALSPPRRPAFSISGERAQRCSTGSMRAGAAARCCCGSRTPIASVRPMPRSLRIIDGLKWLGLDWDGEVIYQFSRAARHREIAEELLRRARPIAATPRRRSLRRCAPRRAPRANRSLRRTLGATAIRTRLHWRQGRHPPARTGLEGETVIEDQVQGRVVWQNENLDDLVLLRSDGIADLHAGRGVDDHDMGVTHIIRGDDHLTNAARQSRFTRRSAGACQ